MQRRDSAQQSRTLRAREQDGLVVVAGHGQHGRVRVASLTAPGRDECGQLEAASDATVAGILEPVSQ